MSKLLLDTHAFIWMSEDSPKLENALKSLIEDTDEVFVSIASFWEIAIKISIGKLSLQGNFSNIEEKFKSTRYRLLPLRIADTIELSRLPFHHRDPFDRTIISQAISNSLRIVSCDIAFDAYSIKRVWEV